MVQEEQRRQRETEVFQHLRKKPGRERIDETLVLLIATSFSLFVAPPTLAELRDRLFRHSDCEQDNS